MRIFKTRRSFKREFRRQIRFAVIAAIGFTIAFAWRNSVFNAFHDLASRFTSSTQNIQTELFTSIIITLVGVILIFITARLLRD